MRNDAVFWKNYCVGLDVRRGSFSSNAPVRGWGRNFGGGGKGKATEDKRGKRRKRLEPVDVRKGGRDWGGGETHSWL